MLAEWPHKVNFCKIIFGLHTCIYMALSIPIIHFISVWKILNLKESLQPINRLTPNMYKTEVG